MTISEAINKIDALKFNTYTQAEKVSWLSTLDGLIKNEIVNMHEGAEEVEFTGYGESTPTDTVLIAPFPYDDMYIKWLEAQIDYTNAEYDKYDNSKLAFNTLYSAFYNWYTRTHKPIGKQFKCF